MYINYKNWILISCYITEQAWYKHVFCYKNALVQKLFLFIKVVKYFSGVM